MESSIEVGDHHDDHISVDMTMCQCDLRVLSFDPGQTRLLAVMLCSIQKHNKPSVFLSCVRTNSAFSEKIRSHFILEG